MKDKELLRELEKRIGPLTPEQQARLGVDAPAPAPAPAAPQQTAPEIPGLRRPKWLPKEKPAPPRRVEFQVLRTPKSLQWHIQARLWRGPEIVEVSCFIGYPEKLAQFRKDRITGEWQPWKPFGVVPPPEIVEYYTSVFNPLDSGLAVPGIKDPGRPLDWSGTLPNSYPRKG